MLAWRHVPRVSRQGTGEKDLVGDVSEKGGGAQATPQLGKPELC